MKKILMALCALTTMSACGGGSATYESTLQEAVSVALQNNYDSLDYTDAANIPTSETASYSGYFGVDVVGTQMIGDLGVSVDFGNNSFDGKVDNLIDDANERYTGQVNMVGTIDRSPVPATLYQMNGSASGTISNADTGTFDVTGDVLGDFLGDDAEALDIAIEGEATDGVGVLPFEGGGFAFR